MWVNQGSGKISAVNCFELHKLPQEDQMQWVNPTKSIPLIVSLSCLLLPWESRHIWPKQHSQKYVILEFKKINANAWGNKNIQTWCRNYLGYLTCQDWWSHNNLPAASKTYHELMTCSSYNHTNNSEHYHSAHEGRLRNSLYLISL